MVPHVSLKRKEPSNKHCLAQKSSLTKEPFVPWIGQQKQVVYSSRSMKVKDAKLSFLQDKNSQQKQRLCVVRSCSPQSEKAAKPPWGPTGEAAQSRFWGHRTDQFQVPDGVNEEARTRAAAEDLRENWQQRESWAAHRALGHPYHNQLINQAIGAGKVPRIYPNNRCHWSSKPQAKHWGFNVFLFTWYILRVGEGGHGNKPQYFQQLHGRWCLSLGRVPGVFLARSGRQHPVAGGPGCSEASRSLQKGTALIYHHVGGKCKRIQF